MSDLTAVDVLRNHQKQCDFDGVEVQVSRQALDEVLDLIESLEKENAALRAFIEARPGGFDLNAFQKQQQSIAKAFATMTPPTTDKGE